MEKINLTKISHSVRMGDVCEYKDPNVSKSSLFYFNGNLVGFYLIELPEIFVKLLNIINHEFRSDNVPKSEMMRNPTDGIDEKTGKYKYKNTVAQYSTIIGSIPPKPHMKRNYGSRSSVHLVNTAQNFIKAMYLLNKESESLLQKYMPEQYELQKSILAKTQEKWRFGDLFTSSISNFNIAAPIPSRQRELQKYCQFYFYS